MSDPNSQQPSLDTNNANDIIQPLVEYHWNHASWDVQDIELLRRFFVEATEIQPSLETALSDHLAKLSSVPLGSNFPSLVAEYFFVSGSTLSEPRVLAEHVIHLYLIETFALTSAAIMDCMGVALRKTTATAFELNSDNVIQCASIVTALQKLFFFQGALLQNVFSKTEPVKAAVFDDATGLPDYKTVLSTIAELLRSRSTIRRPFVLMIAQLTISHLIADGSAYAESELLFAQASDRLKLALRETDIIGRFSRDEFLIVLTEAPGSAIAALAANKIVKTLGEPFEIKNRFAMAKVCVGVALFPEHGQEVETLLHHAEIAREEARRSKQYVGIYDEEFHRQNQRRQSLETMLRAALQEGELEIHFQPQADLNSGRVIGAESLLRWKIPETGWIPPNQIISIAEDSDLMSALTMWIFKTTLRHWAAWTKLGIDITVSINVTPSNLADPELPDFISQALGTWSVPPNKLLVELTEGAMIAENSIEVLHKLKSLGVELSVDDFGTGYSSMAYLKKMPLDELKIDRAFVQNMLTVKEDERIVRSIIDLAHHFDLKVVAEGVEDLPTLQFLRTIGCNIAQGYLISKPLPVEEFVAWWMNCKGVPVQS